MYTSLAPLETICLRCQLRLISRLRPDRLRRRFSSTTIASQHVFSPEKGPAESVIRRVHEKRQPKNSLYSPLIDQRGKNSAKLGIDSLGKPAEVILLRDEEGGESPKKRKWRSISLKDDVRKKNLSHLSQEAIVKMVGSEKDAPDQYQINANLDKLRANMGGSRYTPISVSTTEYDDVFDILFKGYTTEQLMEYVERTLPAVGPSSPHTGPDPVFLFQSIWKPGESSTSKRLPVQGRLQPDGVEQKSPKSALVTRLMQDHWRIQVQEAEDVTGEIEVGVQPWQLSLLTLGQPSHLERMRDRSRAKVEAFSGETTAIIRVTTDLRTARNTVRDLGEMLSNLSSKHIDVRHLKDGLSQASSKDQDDSPFFDWDRMREIERQTRTVIQVVGQEIVLNSILQTDLDDAQRMLLPLLHLPKRISSTTTMDDSQQNDLIRSFVPYSSRPFTCASQLFSRWVQPAKRASKKPVSSTMENGGSSEPDLACSDEFISKLTNNISQQTFQNHTDPRQYTRYWRVAPTHRVSATLGHAIYPHSHDGENFLTNATQISSRTRGINFHKSLVFSPESSGLLPFLKHLDFEGQSWTTKLKLTLIPSPFTKEGPSAILEYPEIHLYFDVTPASLELRSICAPITLSITNVLLPSERSDLRIETKSLMHGTKDLLDHQNVSAFCSELRRSYIEANSKLRAPPSLRIPIPHPLPNSSNPVQQEKNSIAIGAKPVMIDYMFATLEQHQGMAFDFDGNLLEFKGVEGGRIGGSYNEVNLKLKRHASGKAQSSRSSAIGHARPQSYLQAGQRQHQESEGTDNEADGFHHYVAPQFGIRSRNREPKQDTTKTEAPEEVASRSTLPYSDVHSFIRSALRLTSLASNPRPSVYTQPMGWRPGAVDYFKPIQKYDPGSDQNELDEDFEPDPSMAAKTVTDVTNERMNEWLGVKERERWRQREGSTIADLLRGSDEETEGEEGIEVLR
ncbi:hypothetical protein EV356DRAFT_579299 [Viridothelium virens]|uniref:Uncharacterized protein n=1 Tax=Viridothelium virens TaxID=1048519 RepID=A0A6A6H0U0_VIRVR|nr:hypothetical protein EV356DRAFT_579299 [Viridothelium virens]